jgi:hypothetical protein
MAAISKKYREMYGALDNPLLVQAPFLVQYSLTTSFCFVNPKQTLPLDRPTFRPPPPPQTQRSSQAEQKESSADE